MAHDADPKSDELGAPEGRHDRREPGGYEVAPPRSHAADEGAKAAKRAAPEVEELAAEVPPAARERPPRAVFVAHGMGQQIPFATLDAVAEGLRREDAERRGVGVEELPAPRARTVVVDDRELRRIELDLQAAGGGEREVHLYEGYWAWLTQGQVNLRNVMAFLWRAGLRGVRSGTKAFRRRVFGPTREFTPPVRTVVYLLVALATVASLVALNSILAAVAAARSPLQDGTPGWLSDALFADLTTTFNLLLTVMAGLGALLVASAVARRFGWPLGLRKGLARVAALLFLLVLAAVIAAGVAVPMLLWVHGTGSGSTAAAETPADVGGAGGGEADSDEARRGEADRGAAGAQGAGSSPAAPAAGQRERVLQGGVVDTFNRGFRWVLAGLVALAVVVVLLRWLLSFAGGLRRVLADPRAARTWTAVVVAILAGLVALVVWEVRFFTGMVESGEGGVGSLQVALAGLAWAVLVLVSGVVRKLLIQYVGDVAAYVNPQTLDRFAELREQIKERVCGAARAVYAAPGGTDDGFLYDGVAVVGHSLGSVVVYDCLNRLLNQDDLGGAPAGEARESGRRGPLDVARRTLLLLTFGSPLDKTAFLFSLQGDRTGPGREAVAASVQPLLSDPAKRTFPWVNVWSPADIISGELDYYDPPEAERGEHPDAHFVVNQRDPEATTLLAAHNEYWTNREVFRTLHDAVTG